MNRKTLTITIKDTSPSELARFRQSMQTLWQAPENDANQLEPNSLQTTYANTHLIPVTEVIEIINEYQGKTYDNKVFKDFTRYKDTNIFTNCIPENKQVVTYNDSQGNKKNGTIFLAWTSFTGIDLRHETWGANFNLEVSPTEFSLKIFNLNRTEVVFEFKVYDYDLLIHLFKSLRVNLESNYVIKLIEKYKKKIQDSNNNPDKLDTIYETFPDFLKGVLDDKILYDHLDLILNSITLSDYFGWFWGGTNEDKAVLKILYAFKDQEELYRTLRDSDLLYRIYSKLHGEEIDDLLRFLTRLVEKFNTSKPKATVYFENSYYLFRDVHTKSTWDKDKPIVINNYKNKTEFEGELKRSYNPKDWDKHTPPGITEVNRTTYYIENQSFNPLDKINFGTKLGEDGEQVGDESTFVIALKLHNMAKRQSNWDLFNVATDLLSLLSGAGALRIVLTKGAPLAARILAGVVLTKDTTHYAMLSNNTIQKLHDNGYGWLAKLWIAFSVTTDLASLGLSNLTKIAKEGNAASKLAETTDEANEIKKVAKEANDLVKTETRKDVSKMSERQYDKFVEQAIVNDRKIVTLADANQLGTANKIELIDGTGESVGYITRNMRHGAKKGIVYEFNATREVGKIKKGSKHDLKAEVKLLDSESAKQYRLDVKQGEEILYCDFNIPTKITEEYSGVGKILFDDAHTFMKNSKKVPDIDGMFGVWLKNPGYYAHYGGESINLKKFWKAIDENGKTSEEAAFETITGQWAKENGFTKVVIQGEPTREEVIIKFLKE